MLRFVTFTLRTTEACVPIETPEGPNIGLIGSLTASFSANQQPLAFIETPYRRVKKGKVGKAVDYLDC